MRIDWYPECETCEQYGKRYCVGCMPMLMSDGRYTRTGYVSKDRVTYTVTTRVYSPGDGDDTARFDK